jgi:hypothetical protein
MIIKRKKRLDRRALLRGAGTVAIALPWLEIMGRPDVASAQAAVPAKRFLTVYTPGGTVAENFWPTGPQDAPVLSSILAPLQPHLQKLLVLKGLDMKCAIGEQHQAGIVGWLTGSKQDGSPNNYSSFPSIDQVIATKISKGVKAKPSLQMAVRWATGKSQGRLSPINAANFEDAAQPSPIPPQLDPVAIFDDLFGSLMPAASGPNPSVLRQKSILDHVTPRYTSLAAQLGASDKAKLEQHLSKIREIELGLDNAVSGGAACRPPTLIDTAGYNPTQGTAMNESTDEMIPAVGKLMLDMMVMALACDITAVGSFQWSDTEAKHTFPWLQLSEHHHYYQHDGGFKPAECTRIGTWYSEMHASLLSAMDAVDMGGHSLLDESVVFFGSELSEPPSHQKNDMPFFLAGKGGGLAGGRHLDFNGTPHNNLLVSLLNLFGDPRTTYGHPEFCTGPLSGLTV